MKKVRAVICSTDFKLILTYKQKSRHPNGYLLFWYAGRDSMYIFLSLSEKEK